MIFRAALLALLVPVLIAPAAAQTGADPVRIGVLNDMSGVYSDDQGPGSLLAAQMAAEDFGGSITEHALRAAIPIQHAALERCAEDRIVERLQQQCGHERRRLVPIRVVEQLHDVCETSTIAAPRPRAPV